jgi:hypothetical protein
MTALWKWLSWSDVDTIHSSRQLEQIRSFLAENKIAYRLRPELLPPPQTLQPMAFGAVPPLTGWLLQVHPEDLDRVQHYLTAEQDW